ncbi:MAG: NAD(P)/FAD-dependent oxidoreductase [Lachnospiraceae bacterium]|nr:NAD(P)/FAD-dependent oxidoreductase [Lachnospiraceae bacterium]
MSRKILIVGAGAAGMMAGIAAADGGATVTILEKNEKPGKKIFITGKGRCNVTNAGDTTEFFKSVVSNPKFLMSSIYGFDAFMVMDFFETEGCHLKTERGERVFPVTDHSSDIIQTLVAALKKRKVRVRYGCEVEELLLEKDTKKVLGVVTTEGERILADAVIMTTGGVSYASTGSNGKGHEILKRAGHTVRDLRPGLVPLTIKEQDCMELQGLSLRNVEAKIQVDNKEIYDGFGEMLFTHFGVSGPLILTASSVLNSKYYGKAAKLMIDLKPALTEKQLDERLLRDFSENQNKSLKNIMPGLLPTKMHDMILKRAAVDPEKKINLVSKEERLRLLAVMKHLEFTITGCRSFKEAIITMGGIQVKEVNPSTMESKVVPDLYIAGELLDVDAFTGGFNLQIAWSTGHLAGQSAAET